MADQVTLDVVVDIKDALQNIEKFQKEAVKNTKSVASAFDTIKTAAVAAVAVFASSKVVGFFSDATKAAVQQENAINLLNISLAATGEFSEEASAGIQEFANQMQRTTVFGDDLVLNQVAIAKSFGISNDEAVKLVAAAGDLATATGSTLDQSVQELAKTYSGQPGLLAKNVTALKGLTEEQLKAGAAIDVITKAYGGAAQAAAQTFGGSVEQVSNKFGDLLEEVGFLITQNPVVVGAIQFAGKVFDALAESIKNNREGIISFTKSFVGGLIKGFGFVSQGISEIIKVFVTLLTTIGKVRSAVLDFASKTAKFVGLEKAAAGIESFNDSVEGINDSLVGFADKSAQYFEGLAIGAVNSADTLEQTTIKIGASVKNQEKAYVDSAKNIADAQKQIAAAPAVSAPKMSDFIEAQRKITSESAANPVKVFAKVAMGAGGEADLASSVSDSTAEGIGSAAGLLANVLEGRKGAEKLVTGAAGLVADAFLPGIGPVVSQITGLLAQGPEAVRNNIREFIKALPEIIDAIVEAIPVVVDELVDYFIVKGGAFKMAVAIVTSLTKLVPGLANVLGKLLADSFKNILATLGLSGVIFDGDKLRAIFTNAVAPVTNALSGSLQGIKDFFSQIGNVFQPIIDFYTGVFNTIKNIFTGAGDAFKPLTDAIDGLKNAFKPLQDAIEGIKNPFGGGGGGGGFVGKVKGALRLASGGTVPAGFPNDNFPASLTSGEMVVPANDVENLRSLMREMRSGGGQQTGGTIQVNVMISEQQLATALVNLNRRGFRTT